jgi:hypothetical protein
LNFFGFDKWCLFSSLYKQKHLKSKCIKIKVIKSCIINYLGADYNWNATHILWFFIFLIRFFIFSNCFNIFLNNFSFKITIIKLQTFFIIFYYQNSQSMSINGKSFDYTSKVEKKMNFVQEQYQPSIITIHYSWLVR